MSAGSVTPPPAFGGLCRPGGRHSPPQAGGGKDPRFRGGSRLHAFGLRDFHALTAHPVVGASWEGFVIENLLAATPWLALPSYYRISNGAEVDLVLDLPGRSRPWAIEIKRGSVPKVSPGFNIARADLDAERAFVVYGGSHRFPMGDGVEAISLREVAALLRDG